MLKDQSYKKQNKQELHNRENFNGILMSTHVINAYENLRNVLRILTVPDTERICSFLMSLIVCFLLNPNSSIFDFSDLGTVPRAPTMIGVKVYL